MTTVLEARSLTKVYGGRTTHATRALDGVDLKLGAGEFVAIMGPSGSGKTTLLNILSGIDRPTSGTLMLNGQDISSLGKEELALLRRRSLGFIFQDFNVLDSLTVKENIMLPMILDKKPQAQMEKKVAEVTSLLGLSHLAGKYPYQLSGGEQQRIAVGRALVNEPLLLLADEPTGNLDSRTANSLLAHLVGLNETLQTTILMVTHNPQAASFCRRVLFIKDGRLQVELNRKGSQREFFDAILDTLAIVGGAAE